MSLIDNNVIYWPNESAKVWESIIIKRFLIGPLIVYCISTVYLSSVLKEFLEHLEAWKKDAIVQAENVMTAKVRRYLCI